MSVWLQFVASNIAAASLIALLAWHVGRSGRRATLAHVLWLAFFLKLITPPIVLFPITVPASWLPSARAYTNTFSYLGSTSTPYVGSEVAASVSRISVDSQTVSSFAQSSDWTASINFLNTLTCLWIVGFMLILVRGTVRFIRFRRLLNQDGIYDKEATAFVRKLLAAEAERKRRLAPETSVSSPRVLRLPMRVSPMLFGFGGRPVIVCPDQLWRSLTTQERHAFLAHEAAHYCRRDHLVRWLEWFVTAAYWWFPGVYIAKRQLERHEEACCDAWAVQQLDESPRRYAEALLRVVDFISEHRIGIPRIASGMQPTDSLEERLRFVMSKEKVDDSSPTCHWCASIACITLWTLHPLPLPSSQTVTASVTGYVPSHMVPAEIAPHFSQVDRFSQVDQAESMPEIDLPEPPKGFWNRAVDPKWADFSLLLPGAKLVAEANRGITVEAPGRDALRFSSDELTALVEIPATGRVVIGDRAGQLRLWDLRAGMPVSLIGQHQKSITSLAYHPVGGLVSADESGSVMQWDLQSGRVLAAWSGNGPIQSIRYSGDGEWLAILSGRWNDNRDLQKLDFVDGTTLKTLSTILVSANTAVVFESPGAGWVAVNWRGDIQSLQTNSVIASVSKHRVSALMLSQLTDHRSLKLVETVP